MERTESLIHMQLFEIEYKNFRECSSCHSEKHECFKNVKLWNKRWREIYTEQIKNIAHNYELAAIFNDEIVSVNRAAFFATFSGCSVKHIVAKM